MEGFRIFPANGVGGRPKPMFYSRLWVVTAMGYDSFDCRWWAGLGGRPPKIPSAHLVPGVIAHFARASV